MRSNICHGIRNVGVSCRYVMTTIMWYVGVTPFTTDNHRCRPTRPESTLDPTVTLMGPGRRSITPKGVPTSWGQCSGWGPLGSHSYSHNHDHDQDNHHHYDHHDDAMMMMTWWWWWRWWRDDHIDDEDDVIMITMTMITTTMATRWLRHDVTMMTMIIHWFIDRCMLYYMIYVDW